MLKHYLNHNNVHRLRAVTGARSIMTYHLNKKITVIVQISAQLQLNAPLRICVLLLFSPDHTIMIVDDSSLIPTIIHYHLSCLRLIKRSMIVDDSLSKSRNVLAQLFYFLLFSFSPSLSSLVAEMFSFFSIL